MIGISGTGRWKSSQGGEGPPWVSVGLEHLRERAHYVRPMCMRQGNDTEHVAHVTVRTPLNKDAKHKMVGLG